MKAETQCTRFEVNIVIVHVGAVKIYICWRSGKRKEGVKTGWNSVWHKKWSIPEFHPPLKANVLFLEDIFNISPGFGPNSRFGWRVFLTLWKTLVLFFFWPILRCSHKVVITQKKNLAKFGYTIYMCVCVCF